MKARREAGLSRSSFSSRQSLQNKRVASIHSMHTCLLRTTARTLEGGRNRPDCAYDVQELKARGSCPCGTSSTSHSPPLQSVPTTPWRCLAVLNIPLEPDALPTHLQRPLESRPRALNRDWLVAAQDRGPLTRYYPFCSYVSYASPSRMGWPNGR